MDALMLRTAAVAALAISGVAGATCGTATGPRAMHGSTPDATPWLAAQPTFYNATWHAPRWQPVAFQANGDEAYESATIVGLWEFEVRASMDEGPFHQGDLLDWGLATWHDDGTEMQFSAGRPYDAGDVCMGVWKPTGHNKFHLNHIALGKDLATGANFDGPTNIRADVVVDRAGTHYSGSYQIIQYAGSPANGTEFDMTNMMYELMATVSASRVSPD